MATARQDAGHDIRHLKGRQWAAVLTPDSVISGTAIKARDYNYVIDQILRQYERKAVKSLPRPNTGLPPVVQDEILPQMSIPINGSAPGKAVASLGDIVSHMKMAFATASRYEEQNPGSLIGGLPKSVVMTIASTLTKGFGEFGVSLRARLEEENIIPPKTVTWAQR